MKIKKTFSILFATLLIFTLSACNVEKEAGQTIDWDKHIQSLVLETDGGPDIPEKYQKIAVMMYTQMGNRLRELGISEEKFVQEWEYTASSFGDAISLSFTETDGTVHIISLIVS